MQIYDKPIRVLLKDMAAAFVLQPGQSFTTQKAIDWFSQHYPKIKISGIKAYLICLSTNSPNRVYYKPHAGEDDVFFKIDGSHFRLYDSRQDPPPIKDAGGEADHKRGTDEGDKPATLDEFPYEKDLRNYLAKNLSKLEPGLRLHEEERIGGIEFHVGGRFIDILAVSATGDFVVIELKVSRGYDRVVGQLMRYIAWIRKELAEPGQKTRGIIVAREISEDLLLACSMLQDVQLFEYEMSVTLRPVRLESTT